MRHKTILLTLAVVSALILALPAVASAGTWNLDPAGTAFTTSSVGNTVLTTNNNDTTTCTSSTGSGSYNSGSTTEGTIQLKFHGCKESVFGTACTGTLNAGEPSGTITTTVLTFKNVYLEPEAHTPGVTIKGNGATEHFATFKCAGGLVTTVITGTILSEVEEPATRCNLATKKLPILFASKEHGVQKWMQVTTAGEKEDLTATVSGTARTLSLDGTEFVQTAANVTPACTAAP